MTVVAKAVMLDTLSATQKVGNEATSSEQNEAGMMVYRLAASSVSRKVAGSEDP